MRDKLKNQNGILLVILFYIVGLPIIITTIGSGIYNSAIVLKPK